MAALTPLKEKLGEVWGLSQAAQAVTTTVQKMVEDQRLRETLARMHQEAKETADRCEETAGHLEGKKTAVREKAQEAKQNATDMSKIYLDGEEEGLDGFEFLVMAEAGEVGHWEILRELNNQAQDSRVSELVEFALPIQRRHFEAARSGSLELARASDAQEAE